MPLAAVVASTRPVGLVHVYPLEARASMLGVLAWVTLAKVTQSLTPSVRMVTGLHTSAFFLPLNLFTFTDLGKNERLEIAVHSERPLRRVHCAIQRRILPAHLGVLSQRDGARVTGGIQVPVQLAVRLVAIASFVHYRLQHARRGSIAAAKSTSASSYRPKATRYIASGASGAHQMMGLPPRQIHHPVREAPSIPTDDTPMTR